MKSIPFKTNKEKSHQPTGIKKKNKKPSLPFASASGRTFGPTKSRGAASRASLGDWRLHGVLLRQLPGQLLEALAQGLDLRLAAGVGGWGWGLGVLGAKIVRSWLWVVFSLQGLACQTSARKGNATSNGRLGQLAHLLAWCVVFAANP